MRERAIAAAISLIEEGGYDSLSFQAVASRAGVNRSTLYRRWSSRTALAVEAVLRITGNLNPPPDTGSLEGDLRALLTANIRLVGSHVGRTLLVAGLQGRGDEEMLVKREFWKTRRLQFEPIFQRARERGEIRRPIDVEVALAALCGAIYFRSLNMGQVADPAWAERILLEFMAAHSRR